MHYTPVTIYIHHSETNRIAGNLVGFYIWLFGGLRKKWQIKFHKRKLTPWPQPAGHSTIYMIKHTSTRKDTRSSILPREHGIGIPLSQRRKFVSLTRASVRCTLGKQAAALHAPRRSHLEVQWAHTGGEDWDGRYATKIGHAKAARHFPQCFRAQATRISHETHVVVVTSFFFIGRGTDLPNLKFTKLKNYWNHQI